MKNQKNNFGISNLAWDYKKNKEVFEILKSFNVKNIEVAPTKICDWESDSFFESLKKYKKELESYELRVCGLQSIFFNKNINLFKENKEFIKHFVLIIDVCRLFNAKYIVYGSPKTRKISQDDDINIFINTFIELSEIANEIDICIEPNPKEYGCNFITNMKECEEVLKKINKSNIKSHIDLSSIILNNENVKSFNCDFYKTAHISNPYLKTISKDFDNLYNDLFSLNLNFITLETIGDNVEVLKEQLEILKLK